MREIHKLRGITLTAKPGNKFTKLMWFFLDIQVSLKSNKIKKRKAKVILI